MTNLYAGFSRERKAQLKIQQMAFVLVAIIILFALAALIYFSIWLPSIEERAKQLKQEEAQEIVRKLSASAELIFSSSSDCSSCIDLDKALMLKEQSRYAELLNLDYLMIERIYPSSLRVECTRVNYPNCNQITLIDKNLEFGASSSAFVALARFVPIQGSQGYFRYELGRIHASGLENN